MTELRVIVTEEFDVIRSEYSASEGEDMIPITNAMEYEMEHAISNDDDEGPQAQEGRRDEVHGNSETPQLAGQKHGREEESGSPDLGSPTGDCGDNGGGDPNFHRGGREPRERAYCTSYTAIFTAVDPNNFLNPTREFQQLIKKRNNQVINSIVSKYKRARDRALQQADESITQILALELRSRERQDENNDKIRERDNIIVLKNDEIRELRNVVDKLNQEAVHLQKILDEKDGTIRNLEAQKGELQRKLDEELVILENIRNRLSDLEVRFNAKEAEISGLTEQYNATQSQLSAKEIELQSTMTLLEQIRLEKVALETRIENLNQLYTQLQAEAEFLKAVNENITTSKYELEQLKNQEIALLRGILDKEKADGVEKNLMIENLNTRIAGLIKEKNGLNRRVNLYDKALKKKNREMKTSEKEKRKLKKRFYRCYRAGQEMARQQLAQCQAFLSQFQYDDLLGDEPEVIGDDERDHGSDSGHETEESMDLEIADIVTQDGDTDRFHNRGNGDEHEQQENVGNLNTLGDGERNEEDDQVSLGTNLPQNIDSSPIPSSPNH